MLTRHFYRAFVNARSTIVRKNHTIYALSSGYGKCGVAVVRVSGPDAKIALTRMCKRLPPPRTAELKKIRDPETGEILDHGLVLWFPGPASFTGEDCCEYQVHGGPAVLAAIFSAFGKLKNFRPAEPGEFTRRAFHAGKLDLTSVEGLADLINAETEFQRKQAVIQMDGALDQMYSEWRETLSKSLANIEAFIDFEEDENIESSVFSDAKQSIKELRVRIEILQPPDWPVPKYYGSCGRLTVVEDCGIILTDLTGTPWEERARLSVQLLKAAFNFTFAHPELAFYFTDTSPDNIAVDRKGDIRFIDLEHVIIVEKNPSLSEQPPNWNMNHSSSYIPCTGCYTFSPDEICDHRASDYNILAVCREILHNTSLLIPDGFLHSIPSRLTNVQYQLPPLLSQCVENNGYGDRFSVAKDIMKLLNDSVS